MKRLQLRSDLMVRDRMFPFKIGNMTRMFLLSLLPFTPGDCSLGSEKRKGKGYPGWKERERTPCA